MTVAALKQPADNFTEAVIQVEVIPEHQDYSRIPDTPISGSGCSTESSGTTNSGNPAHCTTISSTGSNSSAICRICQDVDKTENLRTLCQCTGSIAKYHVSCLEKWLSVSKTDTCELCQQHFATKRKPRPFSEWVRWVHGTTQSRYIYGDLFCLIILTPLVLVSSALCFEGSWYYFSVGELLIATGLITLCAFLVFLYVLWFVLSLRYHIHRWREWRKDNQVVRVIVPRSIPKQKPKQKPKQETVV